MIDYLVIASAPTEEDCAQVGEDNYRQKALEECARFRELIRKKFGPEPERTRLAIKSFPHDFGAYHEVVCYYDDENRDSMDYAFAVKNNMPETWYDDTSVYWRNNS